MPIPSPRKDEDEQSFLGRCIKTLTKEDPKKDIKQIQAICFGQWQDRKKEAMEEEKYKKDSDGHYIIAENVGVIFNSTISMEEILENKEKENKDGI